MSSQVDIANIALSILGKPTITSLFPPDPSNAAKVISVNYDSIRQGLLMGPGVWRCSIARASLAAIVGVPISGPFTTMSALPADFIRLLQVGDTWPGLDLSDYRLGPIDQDYSLETFNGQRVLLCDYGNPLSLVYVYDLTNTTLMDPNFVLYFAAKIAWTCCERLTGSDAKQAAAEKRMEEAKSAAVATNAFMNPPQQRADDTWVAARMQ